MALFGSLLLGSELKLVAGRNQPDTWSNIWLVRFIYEERDSVACLLPDYCPAYWLAYCLAYCHAGKASI